MSVFRKSLLLAALAVFLVGCATYGTTLDDVLRDVQQGNLAASQDQLKKVLSPAGNDGLLYYLELGVIQHLEGNYNDSTRSFNRAEDIAEKLETVSITGKLTELITSPRNGPYRGENHEKVLINYYKALNYLGLAQNANNASERRDALEGARVEARRMLIRLNDLEDRKSVV